MTTAEILDLELPWDYFLRQDEDAQRRHNASIDRFRKDEWKNLHRQLLKNHRIAIPEEVEPHWVMPGRAIWWQEQNSRVKQFVDIETREVIPNTTANQDKGEWVINWVKGGWQPTSAFPTNNATQIANYLKKGIRLRPPVNGVDAVVFDAAALPEVQAEPPAPERTFVCTRHEHGRTVFRTWSAYIEHCKHYRETPQEEAPEEVRDRMMTFEYYCPMHDNGFHSRKLAVRHLKGPQHKGGTITEDDLRAHKSASPALE